MSTEERVYGYSNFTLDYLAERHSADPVMTDLIQHIRELRAERPSSEELAAERTATGGEEPAEPGDFWNALVATGKQFSAQSWSGFNVYGDAASINEVRRITHEAATVPKLKTLIRHQREELGKVHAELRADAPALPAPDKAHVAIADEIVRVHGWDQSDIFLRNAIAAELSTAHASGREQGERAMRDRVLFLERVEARLLDRVAELEARTAANE